jgi:hypothetical protein
VTRSHSPRARCQVCCPCHRLHCSLARLPTTPVTSTLKSNSATCQCPLPHKPSPKEYISFPFCIAISISPSRPPLPHCAVHHGRPLPVVLAPCPGCCERHSSSVLGLLHYGVKAAPPRSASEATVSATERLNVAGLLRPLPNLTDYSTSVTQTTASSLTAPTLTSVAAPLPPRRRPRAVVCHRGPPPTVRVLLPGAQNGIPT